MDIKRLIRRIMNIESLMTDSQILTEIGQRLARKRLDLNMTQKDLAEEAGVGLRTVQRLEAGAVGTQLSVFIRVCKVLDLIDQLDRFIPESTVSPMALLKQKGKERMRASGAHTIVESPGEWKWGDE